MAGLTEHPVEEYLLAQCRRRGVLCLKFTSPARAGVPDRLLVTPAATVFVEVKRPGGTLRRLQQAMHAKIRRFGGVVHTVDTPAGVDVLLNQLAQRGLSRPAPPAPPVPPAAPETPQTQSRFAS